MENGLFNCFYSIQIVESMEGFDCISDCISENESRNPSALDAKQG